MVKLAPSIWVVDISALSSLYRGVGYVPAATRDRPERDQRHGSGRLMPSCAPGNIWTSKSTSRNLRFLKDTEGGRSTTPSKTAHKVGRRKGHNAQVMTKDRQPDCMWRSTARVPIRRRLNSKEDT